LYHAKGDQIKEDEIGRTCGPNGREIHARFWWGNLKERENLQDLDWRGGMDWILLAQDWKK